MQVVPSQFITERRTHGKHTATTSGRTAQAGTTTTGTTEASMSNFTPETNAAIICGGLALVCLFVVWLDSKVSKDD